MHRNPLRSAWSVGAIALLLAGAAVGEVPARRQPANKNTHVAAKTGAAQDVKKAKPVTPAPKNDADVADTDAAAEDSDDGADADTPKNKMLVGPSGNRDVDDAESDAIGDEDDEDEVSDGPDPDDTEVGKSGLVTGKNISPRLKAALEDALKSPALSGAKVSFLAWSLDRKKLVAESGADILVNPASNTKLITCAAALDVLKPEYRFKTEYYLDGELKRGILNGNLVVKGYGDPSVTTERLLQVANDLHLLGINKIVGNIVVDDSYFDAVREANGWNQEDAIDAAYAAPVGALSVNRNVIGIYVRPDEGNTAFVRADPDVPYIVVNSTVANAGVGRGVRVVSDRGQETTQVFASGSVGNGAGPSRIYRRIYHPELYFGSVLLRSLQQRGVEVTGRVVRGRHKAGDKIAVVDRSPLLTDIVSDLNHFSNNFIAEMLVKSIGAHVEGAPGTFDTGLAVTRKFLEEKVGLVAGTYAYGNGSGLNDVNRFTARQIVQLLTYMDREFETSTEFVTSLAVAGTQGTIGSRMRNTPAFRRLRAKTGTLSGVSTLSGYVADPQQETVAFSILVQGFRGPTSSIWAVQNQIGAALASGGELLQPSVARGSAGGADDSGG